MRAWFACLGTIVCIAGAWAAPVAQFGFEDGVGEWKGITFTLPGTEGGDPVDFGETPVTAVTDAAQVKSGQGALGLSYVPVPGKLFGVARPELSVPGCRSLRLWAKSTAGAFCLFALTERDGSNYMLPLTLLPNRWHEIKLNLSDFGLDEDSNDENGQLDADQIGSLMVADAAGLLGLLAQQAPFLDIKLVPGALYLDDVVFDSEAVTGAIQRRVGDLGPEIVIGDFESEVLTWGLVGAGKVELVNDEQAAAGGVGCLKVTYDLDPGKVAILATNSIAAAKSADMYALRMKIKSSEACTCIIQLEERDGSKYSFMLELTASDQWGDKELALDDFVLEENGIDENGQLDPEQVKGLVIINAAAMGGQAAFRGELWLDEVALLTP